MSGSPLCVCVCARVWGGVPHLSVRDFSHQWAHFRLVLGCKLSYLSLRRWCPSPTNCSVCICTYPLRVGMCLNAGTGRWTHSLCSFLTGSLWSIHKLDTQLGNQVSVVGRKLSFSSDVTALETPNAFAGRGLGSI